MILGTDDVLLVMSCPRSPSTGANCPPQGEKPLSRDTQPPYVDNRPMLAAGKPELRQHKAIFIVDDQEVSQFSDEIIVNCAPLV
jgi:hypothetical protein